MPMASPPAPAKSSTLFIEKPPNHRAQVACVRELAFPDCQHLPPQSRERAFVFFIPEPVAFQFRNPEINTGFRQSRKRASRVPVPETTVNEDDLPARREHEVGTSRKRSLVEAVTIAKPEDKLADQQLRARVLGAHARHDSGSLPRSERVHKI